MILTKEQYDIAENYLEWLRQDNCRNRATVTLITDKEERQDKVEQLETESNAINILLQVLSNAKIKV